MNRPQARDVAAGFAAARRRFFLLTLLEMAAFLALLAGWAFLLMPRVHVAWLLVPALPLHLLFAWITRRRVVCPACGVPLAGDDGFAPFAEACDHCGARFR